MIIKYTVYKEEWEFDSLLERVEIKEFEDVESAVNLKKELSEKPDNKGHIYIVEVEEVE